jgi:hypothetical protein
MAPPDLCFVWALAPLLEYRCFVKFGERSSHFTCSLILFFISLRSSFSARCLSYSYLKLSRTQLIGPRVIVVPERKRQKSKFDKNEVSTFSTGRGYTNYGWNK